MSTVIENVKSRAQKPFTNEPLTDFSKEELKGTQIEALEQVKSELGRTYPLIIGGKKVTSEQTFASINPAQPNQVIGHFVQATVAQANEAVQVATTTFETWKLTPAEIRASYLF